MSFRLKTSLRLKKNDRIFLVFALLFGLLFFNRYLIELGVPSVLRYTLDIVNAYIFILALKEKVRIGKVETFILLSYVIVLLFGTLAAALSLNTWGGSLPYYLFDCRNLIRFVLFFYSCSVLLSESIVEKIFKLFFTFHVINCIFIVYQYFTLEVPIYWMRGDNLNGFFGTATGGNIYVNALLVSTSIIAVDKWSKKICSFRFLLCFLGLNLLIAVLIELKAFFAEIAIITLVYSAPYFKRLTAKRIAIGFSILVIVIVLFTFLIQLLYRLYPSMQGTISIGHILESGGKSDSSEIGRLSFFTDVVRLIYSGDWIKAFLGVGLGIANTNNLATPFAQKYFGTNYSWYSMPYVFIETGICGLAAYIWSFLSILIYTSKKNKYYLLAVSATLLSIFILFYDEAFKTEAGYLLFFILSIPLIKRKMIDDSFLRNRLKYVHR